MLSAREEDILVAANEKLQEYIQRTDQILAVSADLTYNSEVVQLAQQVDNAYGRADILIHCAGQRDAARDFLEITDEGWQETIELVADLYELHA